MPVSLPALSGDGQVDFEEFVTLLGPKLAAAGMPDKFHGADFDSVFWKVGIIHRHYHHHYYQQQQSYLILFIRVNCFLFFSIFLVFLGACLDFSHKQPATLITITI